MKRVIFLLIVFLASGTCSFSQVPLTSIKNSPVKFKIPIAQRTIPGQTGYFQEYGDLAVLMDSVGIPEGVIIDSMAYNQTTDTLSLFTSSGTYKAYIPVTAGVTSVGLTLGTSGTDANVTGSPVTGSGSFTLNLPTGSSTNRGLLSSTDWTTFNNKLGSLNGLTAATQTFAKTTTGADFTIASTGATHTFNLPFEGSGTGLRLGVDAKVVSNCVAIGSAAMQSATATNNIAIGADALKLTGSTGSGGTNNVGIGAQSLDANTTGLDNFGMGSSALTNNNTGNYNIAIGTQAMQTNTTGSGNTVIGYRGLQSSTTTENTSIGYFARRAGSGHYNTDIGSLAGEQASGSENTIIGYAAGRFNTGSFCVMIGEFSGYNNTSSNVLYIDNSTTSSPLIGGDFSSNRVGINTSISSIARTLHVTGEARITDLTTDTPTRIVGADADGDLAAITVSTGLNLSGGNLTNSGDLSNTNELQTISTSGAAGNITLSNGGGTLNLNVNDADASTTNELQTLSFSTPNLSISSGNSVTLPVLPAGTSSHTLAYLSGTWTSSSFLKNNSSNTTTGNSKRVTINDDISGESWPLSVHTATKFLVNGRVQMNSTASTAVTSIMGRNNNMEVGNVTPGANMDLTSGILSQKQVLGVLARNSSSSTFSTSSTPVKIDFNQPMVQVNATANTSNDDIVTTVSNYGAYEITCDCQFNAGATATYNFGIYVNGSLNGSLVKQIPMTSGTTHDVMITGYVSSLATSDEVDIRVSTTSGTSGNTIGRCLLALKGI